MARVAFELVDAGVIAARDGTTSAPSPGIALLDPAGLSVGREAAAQARIRPVFAFDGFWSELSTDPLPRPVARATSRADLAYAQLVQLWAEHAGEGDAALFAVPGTMRPPEVGLLAGIAQAASIPVEGYVDLAVAACASLEAQETVLHLDLQLHQAVLTELHGSPGLRRRRVEVAPRAGLRTLHGAWAQLIAEAMVRRTRFDPLHVAAAEQQLYDRLPGWLAQLATGGSVDVELEASAGRFGVSLRREQFVFAAEAWYTQLADLIQSSRRAGEPVTIALSSRAAVLPALAERCSALGEAEVVALPEAAAALGALARAQAIAEVPGALLVELEREHAPRQAALARPRLHGTPPTHVVYAGRAHRISPEPLTIGLAGGRDRSIAVSGPAAGISRSHCTVVEQDGAVVVRDHSRHGTYLNGERITGSAALAAGDRLRVGTPGVVLELVAAG